MGDFLIVNELVYGAEIPGTPTRLPALAEPRRGDVVVFNPPHDPVRNFVKRVVGVPGRPWFVYCSFNGHGPGGLPWRGAVRWGRIGSGIH